MQKTWANSGVDLHLQLAGPRVRLALETALRDAIRAGRLGASVRLPSSRVLAHDLGISRNTVAAAYGSLVVEGWLTARQGSGTRVAARAVAPGESSAHVVRDANRIRFDLRAGSPDVANFPRAGWLAAARRALAVAPSEALGYGDPRGRAELRRALADYLSRARGVYADPDRIVICSGFAQGLVLLCEALRAAGATTLATEAYCHPGHRDAIAASGLRPTPVEVDADGAAVSQFGDADAALLTRRTSSRSGMRSPRSAGRAPSSGRDGPAA